jgi:hypothetical protein
MCDINPVNCHAYIKRNIKGVQSIGQCMHKKMVINDKNSIFCIRHQTLFDNQGMLKNGYYQEQYIEFNEKSYNINTKDKYITYERLKKQLLDNNNYSINKLNAMKKSVKF